MVVAEDGNGLLPSYLDLRFPESDIPAQARELYRRNRVRLIADNNYTPAPLMRAEHHRDAPATDLSLAVLRSVSPVHLHYMRNMGTGASMSVSLVHKASCGGWCPATPCCRGACRTTCAPPASSWARSCHCRSP